MGREVQTRFANLCSEGRVENFENTMMTYKGGSRFRFTDCDVIMRGYKKQDNKIHPHKSNHGTQTIEISNILADCTQKCGDFINSQLCSASHETGTFLIYQCLVSQET